MNQKKVIFQIEGQISRPDLVSGLTAHTIVFTYLTDSDMSQLVWEMPRSEVKKTFKFEFDYPIDWNNWLNDDALKNSKLPTPVSLLFHVRLDSHISWKKGSEPVVTFSSEDQIPDCLSWKNIDVNKKMQWSLPVVSNPQNNFVQVGYETLPATNENATSLPIEDSSLRKKAFSKILK